jgi:threonine dehydrogenase-like Zn-dependent dehydrogenase
MQGSGVCGSSVPVWEGRDWFEYPLAPGAPGHEGWGIIDALGPQVQRCRVGERVAVLSYNAFAQYDLADASAVVPLPAALDGMPFPGEPLGCAMNIFRRSDIRAGQTVAVVGVGFLGALLVQLAAQAGARVIGISRRPFAQHIARTMGAHEVFGTDDAAALVEQVQQMTGGGCERVIEVTGKQAPLDLAGQLTAVRGRLIIAGFHQDGPRQVDMQLWNWRGLDVVNAHEREPHIYIQGIRAAVEQIASGQLNPTPLYTHTFGLDQVSEAHQATSERPDEFLKSLVIIE